MQTPGNWSEMEDFGKGSWLMLRVMLRQQWLHNLDESEEKKEYDVEIWKYRLLRGGLRDYR